MDGMIQPTERSGHSCVMHEGIAYLWGGQKDGHYFNDLFIFDVNSGKLKQMASRLSLTNNNT
jgi:hypothetical protein